LVGNIIGIIIIGLLAGFLGRALLPGKQSMGLLMTIVLGIAGAAAGYFIFTELLGIGDNDKFDLGGLPGAVIGSMILLFIYERVVGGSDPAPAVTSGAGLSDADKAARRERRRERRL